MSFYWIVLTLNFSLSLSLDFPIPPSPYVYCVDLSCSPILAQRFQPCKYTVAFVRIASSSLHYIHHCLLPPSSSLPHTLNPPLRVFDHPTIDVFLLRTLQRSSSPLTTPPTPKARSPFSYGRRLNTLQVSSNHPGPFTSCGKTIRQQSLEWSACDKLLTSPSLHTYRSSTRFHIEAHRGKELNHEFGMKYQNRVIQSTVVYRSLLSTTRFARKYLARNSVCGSK